MAGVQATVESSLHIVHKTKAWQPYFLIYLLASVTLDTGAPLLHTDAQCPPFPLCELPLPPLPLPHPAPSTYIGVLKWQNFIENI